jgi:hypothetical protein
VDTTTPRSTAYLLVAGLVLSTIGTLLAGDEANASTWTGGVLLLAGFATVLTGLVRWALRARASSPAEVRRTPAAV